MGYSQGNPGQTGTTTEIPNLLAVDRQGDGKQQRVGKMPSIDTFYLRRSDPSGAMAFGCQPFSIPLEQIGLTAIQLQLRVRGGPSPKWFHVKQKIARDGPGLS